MKIMLHEHRSIEISRCTKGFSTDPLSCNEEIFALITTQNLRQLPRQRGKVHPFLLSQKSENIFELQANYYIGVDWLVKGHRAVQVAPKINTKITAAFEAVTDAPETEEEETDQTKQLTDQHSDASFIEVDYLRILLDIMSSGIPSSYTNDLVFIDWDSAQIPITQQEDRLTPFLVIQFLQLLKAIVRKGLKRSYYTVQENLNSKVKGKILVGQHIKQNVLKNRITKTYCEYQVFGEDNTENRFLKKVFCFASNYLQNNKECFAGNEVTVEGLVNYCGPAFEHISNELKEDQLKQIRHNPFFKEYKEAITIGRHILRKFAYNITETSSTERKTPPFWIDMPRLFELYCYQQLLKANPENKQHIHYQFSTYGNALDILISKPGCEMVIDVKYKLHYQHSHIHQDIRQVSGYARLHKVRRALSIEDDRNIDCLIIYPDTKRKVSDYSLGHLLQNSILLKAYHKVYKLGIPLPTVR